MCFLPVFGILPIGRHSGMDAEPGQDIAAEEKPCRDDHYKNQKFFHGFIIPFRSCSGTGRRPVSTGRDTGRNGVC